MDSSLTFNVVFTTGTAECLLPFTLSLVQACKARFRLVDNAGSNHDRHLLEVVAEKFPTLSYFRLPDEHPTEHGVVLNTLFTTFDEPEFCIVDSDVFALGSFLPALVPLSAGSAGVFSAPPVWVEDAETVVPHDCTYVYARQRRLADGTEIGATYCAVYDRSALETIWHLAPNGFARHNRFALPGEARALLAARGWRFVAFDTGRALNMLLLAKGYRLENRNIPALHHLGGFSSTFFPREQETLLVLVGRLLQLLSAAEDGRWRLIADVVRHRRYLSRIRRESWHRRMNKRRRLVLDHLTSTLSALLEGAVLPPLPDSGSDEVDTRLRGLHDALTKVYLPNLALCRDLAAKATS